MFFGDHHIIYSRTHPQILFQFYSNFLEKFWIGIYNVLSIWLILTIVYVHAKLRLALVDDFGKKFRILSALFKCFHKNAEIKLI
jgi:hypothetical protein